jgi:histone deacetylase complex regulatory component SIN3
MFLTGLLSSSAGDIVKSNDGSFKRLKTPMPLGPLISPHYPGLVGPTAPQELLSTMLAASRKAKASQPLTSFAITAANRAMGSAPGIVHVSDSMTTLNASVGLLKKNLEPGPCNKKNEVASSAAGDPGPVKSTVPSLSAPVGLRSDDDNVANGSSTSPNDSGTGAVEGGLQQVQALSASKPVGESDAIHKDERKNKNAVDFLKEVKAHLSVGEYKGFLECMRGLKNQTINMSNLLQLISNLFSAPERLFLLCRFGDFVPSQHQPAYNLLLEAKQAEHGVPPGESRIEQSKTRLSLAGFSSHSRKQVLDRGSAGPS